MTINDLRTVFRGDWLSSKPVWLLGRSRSSYPWYAWRTATVQHPAWWTDYNATKHDRFGNAKKATLSTTIHALKGTFLALVTSLEFRPRLVGRGVVRSSSLDYASLQAASAAWEPLATGEIVVASTRLFGYKFLSTGSPRYARDTTVFLR